MKINVFRDTPYIYGKILITFSNSISSNSLGLFFRRYWKRKNILAELKGDSGCIKCKPDSFLHPISIHESQSVLSFLRNNNAYMCGLGTIKKGDFSII